MYGIEIDEDAEAELDDLRAYDRMRVLDEIEEQLTHDPATVTRRKKILKALQPPWDQLGPVWQLRVGDYRIFYDVLERERLVIVRAVRMKLPHRTTEEML
jgi:mRNA-degrading endonuclease RelE of RelBE toxin-antitoxin system